MASKRIDITIAGTDKTKSAYDSASKGMKQISDSAQKAGQSVGDSMTKGTSQAQSALSKLGSTSTSTFGMIKAGASAASNSIGGIGNALASVAGGYSALQAVQLAWSGATQRQFNEAYLRTKMAGGQADKYLDTIQKIVAEVPGSDTWMNSLLTGALARQTSLTEDKLRRLGVVASKYVTAAQQTGAAILPVNAERELTQYIKTGNVGLMVRDGILKNHTDKLEGIKTVDGRILALEQAMTEEGYMQIDTLSLASSKWEVITGNVELAATNVGMKLLPYVERVLNFILDLDKETNGWSTTIGFVGAALIGLGIALAPLVTATASAATAMAAYRKDAEKAALANAVNKGPGMPTGGAGGAGGRDWSKYGAGAALAGKTLAGVAGGLIAGDFLAEILKGPMEALTGQKAFKAYGGVSNLLGLGTPVSEESYNEKTIENAKKYGATIHDNKKEWDDFVNSVKSGAGDMSSAFMSNVEMFKTSWTGWIDGAKTKVGELGASWNAGWAWIRGAALNTIGAVVDAWNWMKGIVGSWINTGISVATGAIDAARNAWNGLKDFVMNNPIVGTVRQVLGMGPAGASGARGPGMGLHYENYAGHKKNAWNAAGTGMSGNCVDMTLGAMGRWGGSMVQGTWNGGSHVWWKSPGGKEYDFARKALEGTMTPPARGPGGGNFGNIIIQGDVYGFDDFKRKVEKANASIGFDAARF